jgi:hypothetical protein
MTRSISSAPDRDHTHAGGASAPTAWSVFLTTTPLLGLSLKGVLILFVWLYLFQRRRDRPDDAEVDARDARIVRVGVAVNLWFAVAWLRLAERSPLASLPFTLASLRKIVTPEIGRALLGLAPRGLAVGALVLVVVISALFRVVRSFPGRRRALARAVIIASVAVGGAASAGGLAQDVASLAFAPPVPLWERIPLAHARAMTPHAARTVRYGRVFLVLMECFGADAMRELAAEEGPMRRIGRRADRFDSVLAPSNASHLAQPAVLVSRDLTHSDRHLYYGLSVPPQPRLGAAAWFRANGYRTVMVSSQDEGWLGMDRVVASQPWSTFVHSLNTADVGARYRDACGVTKVLDSVTIARFIREIDAAPGPVFGYLNLQNTHFPYIIESGGRLGDYGNLTCADFAMMPRDRLGAVRARQRQALRESAARVEQLIDRYPDALVVLVSDHGEEMVAGTMFGHAKRLAPAQFETFAWFIGPGTAGGARPARASLLDVLPSLIERVAPGELAALPQGIFTGHSLWSMTDVSSRVFFAVSSGTTTAYTAVRGDMQLQVVEGVNRCALWSDPAHPLDETRCRDLQRPLSDWLSCQVTFARGLTPLSRGSFNPCHALFEGLGPYHVRQ